MRGAERGFLLLTGALGDPNRKPMTVAQMRVLASRVRESQAVVQDRDLTAEDLTFLGYPKEAAQHILHLLSETAVLDRYLQRGEAADCVPISRVSDKYPDVLRQRLGLESPGCIWAKGNISLLDMPKVALVGSRDILAANRAFAWEVGAQAAKQGYALVSGNARGSDRIAQSACLKNGGVVISVVADSLEEKPEQGNILYLSECDFDQPFTAQRAISRNRLIHALPEKTFVAQCAYESGGTWDGTVKNLRHGWSPVFCMEDGSKACCELQQMGAVGITSRDLVNLEQLQSSNMSFFDQ
ncbi:MAG: DNA-processing protein DprA [Oscillospiraceae bacterium]|nr:DNA-processing protein DprA [Oscillospiraceae bacterium]